MTEVATTLRTAYLAGPMRGIEEFNFPAFHKQTAWLRGNGWTVFSPAERDEADEALNGDWATGKSRGLDYFMQFDLAAVAQADCVIAMEGWESSQGARLEMVTAVELDHPVFEIVKGGPKAGGSRKLVSVDPQYVREIFYLGGQAVDGDDVKILPSQCCGLGGCAGCGPWTDADGVTVSEGETISSEATGDKAYDPSLSELRKAMPVATGVLDYFPAALLEVAKVSKAGNDKHNPGQPLHHARGKSTGHADSLLRHLIDRGGWDEETGQRHSAEVAWRALAMLQQELEDDGAPLARGAVLPEPTEEEQIAMLAKAMGIDLEGLA